MFVKPLQILFEVYIQRAKKYCYYFQGSDLGRSWKFGVKSSTVSTWTLQFGPLPLFPEEEEEEECGSFSVHQ